MFGSFGRSLWSRVSLFPEHSRQAARLVEDPRCGADLPTAPSSAGSWYSGTRSVPVVEEAHRRHFTPFPSCRRRWVDWMTVMYLFQRFQPLICCASLFAEKGVMLMTSVLRLPNVLAGRNIVVLRYEHLTGME